jgi:TetR/AcrR family transcriptional regulator, cholesterol catabolism regulator
MKTRSRNRILPISQRDGEPHEQILAAAADLFMKKGFHASTVREIGDRLGISQSSLYYHAKSKLQILVDLNESFMSRLLLSMEAIAVRPVGPSAKVRAVVAELVSAISQYQAEVTVVLHERRSLPARRLNPIQKHRDRIDEILDGIIQDGIDSGEFRRLDVPLTRLALTGMCNWAYTWYHADGRMRPEQIADHFSSLFLEGVSSPK